MCRTQGSNTVAALLTPSNVYIHTEHQGQQLLHELLSLVIQMTRTTEKVVPFYLTIAHATMSKKSDCTGMQSAIAQWYQEK